MTVKLQGHLTIKADAIIITPAAYGKILTFTMFNVDAPSLERLKKLQEGDIVDGITLIDLFEDGTEDEHMSPRLHKFLQFQAPEHRKPQVRVVTFSLS